MTPGEDHQLVPARDAALLEKAAQIILHHLVGDQKALAVFSDSSSRRKRNGRISLSRRVIKRKINCPRGVTVVVMPKSIANRLSPALYLIAAFGGKEITRLLCSTGSGAGRRSSASRAAFFVLNSWIE